METEELSSTAIQSLRGNDEGAVQQSDEGLSFYGFQPNTAISVYTAGGMLVASGRVDVLGHSSLSMSAWTKGVYIIKVGNVTYKILKK